MGAGDVWLGVRRGATKDRYGGGVDRYPMPGCLSSLLYAAMTNVSE